MVWTLLRLRIRAFFSSVTGGSGSKKPRGRLGRVAFSALMLYALCAVVFSFGMLFTQTLPLCGAGYAWLYFCVMAVVAAALCFMLTVFAAQNTLFAAKDNDLLLSMPLTPAVILSSRLGLLLFLCCVYGALVILPAIFLYARNLPVTAAGAVGLVFACLLLPFGVLTPVCLFAWGSAAISARMRRKNAAVTVLSLLLLCAYFLLYTRFNRYIGVLLQNAAAAGEALRRVAWPLYAFGKAAAGELRYLPGLALCTLLPFALCFGLLARGFLRIAAGGPGAPRVRYVEQAHRTRTPMQALGKKELRSFLSTPVYMLNASLGLVFMVALVVAFLIMGGDMAVFLELAPGEVPYGALLCAGLCFCACMNFISAPSLSLEGENLWILKALPLCAGDALCAKARTHIRICLPFVLLAGCVAALGLRLHTGAGIGEMLPLLLLPLCVVILCAYVGIALNLRFPRFDWVTKTQPVKQSMASGLAMLVNFAVVAGGVCFYVWLADKAPLLALYGYGALLLLVALLLRRYLYGAKAAERFLRL